MHSTRIPSTPAVRVLVRDFVLEKRNVRERVTARQVLDMLIRSQVITLPFIPDGSSMTAKGLSAGMRAVQRYLSDDEVGGTLNDTDDEYESASDSLDSSESNFSATDE